MQNLRLMTNDGRIAYFSGRKNDYLFNKRELAVWERVALKRRVDLIAIETSKKNQDKIPVFKKYDLVKKFSGKKNIALILKRKS